MGEKAFFFRLMPPGALLIMTLGGLMVLSSTIYYKAEKFHRYLEPSLAISEPNIEFSRSLRQLIEKEFGNEPSDSFFVASESIFVKSSLLSGKESQEPSPDTGTMEKLSSIFLSLLDDPHFKTETDLILIVIRHPESPHSAAANNRSEILHETEQRLLNALFESKPLLRLKHGYHFAAFTLSGPFTPDAADWIEFRILRNRMMHIDMIETLKKYLR